MLLDQAKCLLVSTALTKYEKVNVFVYSGSIIEADGGSSAEIWRRTAVSKPAVTSLRYVT